MGVVYWNKEHTTESRLREERHKFILDGSGIEVVVRSDGSIPWGGVSHGVHWGTLVPFLKGCQKQRGAARRPMSRHETFAILNRIKGTEVWPDGASVDELD